MLTYNKKWNVYKLWYTIEYAIPQASDVVKRVCLTQGCLESGYGTATIMKNANAFFGIKATKSWRGKRYNARTREVYNNVDTIINDTFRAYDSIVESIQDWYALMHLSNYSKMLTASNVGDAFVIIKNGGYATDPKYVQTLLNVYEVITNTGVFNHDPKTGKYYEIDKMLWGADCYNFPTNIDKCCFFEKGDPIKCIVVDKVFCYDVINFVFFKIDDIKNMFDIDKRKH